MNINIPVEIGDTIYMYDPKDNFECEEIINNIIISKECIYLMADEYDDVICRIDDLNNSLQPNELGIYFFKDKETRELFKKQTVESMDKKYSYWEYNPNGNYWGIGAWICHECNAKNNNLPGDDKINPFLFVGSKFCPNCGLPMIKFKN